MTGEKAELNQLKCHVTNLGAPNGHMSKPKIQMQSIVFFRGANSLVISVVLFYVHEACIASSLNLFSQFLLHPE